MKYLVFVAFIFILASESGKIVESSTNFQELAIRLPEITGSNTSQIAGQVPIIEDMERLFKEKCLKNSNVEVYNKAKDEAKECLVGLVNTTVLQEEVDKAIPTGDLDEVIQRYCRKSTQLSQCISNFTTTIEPCLDEAERESKYIFLNVTDKLLEFSCFRDGDRIALFIAEDGLSCLQNNQEKIERCVKKTFKRHIPNNEQSIDNDSQLIMGVEECKGFRKLQACIVQRLETCNEPTIAHIVESLFKSVYKVTPCENLQ